MAKSNRNVTITLNGKDDASDEIRSVMRSLRGLEGTAKFATKAIAAVWGANMLKDSVMWGIRLTASMENLNVQFTTMLGSGDKAKALMADLNNFAAVTPFETEELAEASKMLLAFGVSQEQIIPTLTRVGDIAAALGIPLTELSEIYGKARVQGRLFAEDVNQLTGRGIPVTREFAKQFGVAESEVRKLVESGKIGFAQLEKAFVDLTAEGSQFGGGMAALSETLEGKWSSLVDEVKMMAVALGDSVMPAMKETVSWAAQFAKFLGEGAASLRDIGIKDIITMDMGGEGQQQRRMFESFLKEGTKAGFDAAQAQLDSMIRMGLSVGAQSVDDQLRISQGRRQLDRQARAEREAGAAARQNAGVISGLLERAVVTAIDWPREKGAEFGEMFAQGARKAGEALSPIDDFINGTLPQMGDAGERFARMLEQAKTPAERIREQLADVKNMFDRGWIDEKSYSKIRNSLIKQLNGSKRLGGGSDGGGGVNSAFESNRRITGPGTDPVTVELKQIKQLHQRMLGAMERVERNTARRRGAEIQVKGF